MSAIRNKQRLVHLYRYLMKYTDEDHQATTNDLVDFLKKEDANASRKTVKDDIEVLIEEGVDVVVNKSFYNSYFVGSRRFEVPEIRLLVEGLAPNKSISKEKKKELIEKLLSLLSVHQADKIRKRLRCHNDHSSAGGQLYYYIDQITEAIDTNRKIEFLYSTPAPEGTSGRKAERKRLVITPTAIRSGDDYFYLCGFGNEDRQPVLYRLDRIRQTRILPDEGDVCPTEQEIARIRNSLFEMEGGELTAVTLKCSSEMEGVIREKFGNEAEILRSGRENFYVKALVSVSPAFYSWVFRHSPSIRIVSPAKIRNEYIRKIREAAEAAEDR